MPLLRMRAVSALVWLFLIGLSECSFGQETQMALDQLQHLHSRHKRTSDFEGPNENSKSIQTKQDIQPDVEQSPDYPLPVTENDAIFDNSGENQFDLENDIYWTPGVDSRDKSTLDKRPFVLGGGIFGKRQVLKDGYQMGNEGIHYTLSDEYGKTPLIIGNYGSINKRPFVLGGGYSFGKRDFGENLPIGHEEFENYNKRPFVLGRGYKYGKRSGNVEYGETKHFQDTAIEKRPFVLSGGYRYGYGKRDTTNPDNNNMDKRPFVLSGGFRGGKRNDAGSPGIDKRPFVLGGRYRTGKRDNYDLTDVNKRPFVLGGGYRYGKRGDDLELDKRPFVLGGGFRGGKRGGKPGKNALNKRPFILSGGYRHGKRDSSNLMDLNKRPFVLSGGFRGGKRGANSENEGNDLDKRPFVLGGYGKRNGFENGDHLKIPFVFGDGYEYAKRDGDSFFDVIEKKPFVLGGDYRGKRYDDVVKRPFVLSGGYNFLRGKKSGANIQDMSEMEDLDTYYNDLSKRPFVLGGPFTFGRVYGFGRPNHDQHSNNFINSEIVAQKRPFVLGGGSYRFGKRPRILKNRYKIGKRDPSIFRPDELSNYVDDFTMDKRPFVLSHGFGSRQFGF